MFLQAKMAWLPGYPLDRADGGVRWATLPRRGERPAEQLRLDRQELQDATFTWSKLVHRFPRALPYVVEDVDRWRVGVPELLDLLKGAVHHDRALPESLFGRDGAYPHAVAARAERTGRRHPQLRTLLNALSWCLYLTPADAPAALAWLDARAQPLKTLLRRLPGPDGAAAALTLWELARRDGARRVDPLVDLLGDEWTHTVTMEGGAPLLESWEVALQQAREGIRPRKPPRRPTATIRTPIVDLIRGLPTQNRGSRRRAAELLSLLLPPPQAERWQRWWQRTDPLLERARRLIATPATAESTAESERLQAELVDLRAEQPPPLHIGRIVANVKTLANPERGRLCDEVVATLRALPTTATIAGDDAPARVREVRAALLHRWLGVAAWVPSTVTAYLPAFRGYLGSADPTTALLPWSSVVAGWRDTDLHYYFPDVEQHLLYDVGRDRWISMLDTLALALASTDGALDLTPSTDTDPTTLNDTALALIRLADVGGDTEQALRRYRELAASDLRLAHRLSNDLLMCAHQLDRDGERFADLVAALAETLDRDRHLYEGLQALDTAFDAAGRTGLVRALIDDGALGELRVLAQRLIGLRALVDDTPVPGELVISTTSSWRERYPAELHPTLDALTAATPDAERIADDLLGRTFPTVEALERERRALTHRLTERPDDAGLVHRLATIEARLESYPPTVPAARRRRLGHKLARRVRREELRRWSRRFESDLRAALAERLEVAEVPDALLAPRPLAILAALLELPRPYRELGLRLLRRRCGPPPWLPHDDPANRAFVERLVGRGIALGPWLDPTPSHIEIEGRTFTLAFEDDPLEILDMGGHFDTCLSPGDINFFSTVVNAADVNKRVVYARDKRGSVVGRCLLALGERGELLVFEPYAHDRALGFSERMGAFVEALAARMGASSFSGPGCRRSSPPTGTTTGPGT
jgi:hypothetical protein